MAATPHHPKVRRIGREEHAERGLRELAVVAGDDDIGIRTDSELRDLRGVVHDDTLVGYRSIARGAMRDEAQMKAEHLPEREERPTNGPAADNEKLGPADGPGDGLARREGPDLDADARGVVPVVRPLEPDVLAKRARRVGSAGSIESVTAECPEARAALENAEGHAFASGRIAFEPGNGDQRRSLTALERFANGGSRLHVT